jgi:hypothetical protein
MKNTLFAILTDADARESTQVAANLSEEFSAGAPWFNVAEE